MYVKRLGPDDRDSARTLFILMANVFEEGDGNLNDDYLDRLLGRDDFWAVAAFADATVVGGLTAHTLPMTRTAMAEILIYDIAVQDEYQRTGVGRALVDDLREKAAGLGIYEVFVLADNDDLHALDFYRALGGTESPVTSFSFSRDV